MSATRVRAPTFLFFCVLLLLLFGGEGRLTPTVATAAVAAAVVMAVSPPVVGRGQTVFSSLSLVAAFVVSARCICIGFWCPRVLSRPLCRLFILCASFPCLFPSPPRAP